MVLGAPKNAKVSPQNTLASKFEIKLAHIREIDVQIFCHLIEGKGSA